MILVQFSKLKIIFLLCFIEGILFETSLFAQSFLSNLSATENDPIYTTYNSALSRSEYIVNEGYQFVWYDPQKGMNFETNQAGNIGLVFKKDGIVKEQLQQYYQKPVITTSYSDLVKFNYYPFKDVKVEECFLVYSSRIAVRQIKITNESSFDKVIDIYPFIQNINRFYSNVNLINDSTGIEFNHEEYPDGWMKEHNIPFQKNLKNILLLNLKPDDMGSYLLYEKKGDTSKTIFMNSVNLNYLNKNIPIDKAKIISLKKRLNISAGQTVELKLVRGVIEPEKNVNELITQGKSLMKEDLNKYVLENEKIYKKIPLLKFNDKDKELLYWNAFSLIRQCMLPPEGECHYNYYVFSREPKWGWGYGGQVFHESLTMLAYVFMDPESAMNSQRVFMERQHPDGYINYRTGPYLNETIPENGQLTTSAPWFNWENWEIYKVTKDKNFLKQAYESGKKFYNYYINNRDSDNDGLCEWGANAVLESVRDARVAVWDEVGDPSNFEAVDCNIMLVKEAKSLASMANELGLKEEADNWAKDAERRTELINKYMWDTETGFYYNVNKKDHSFTFKTKNDLKRKEIIAFLALWAEIANKNQANALMKHLLNPKEFWRKYGVPTLSADDKYYNPIGYWNGPVWVQWDYLIFRGLLNYGYKKEAKELAEKIMTNMIHQLKTDHWFWEFYSPDEHQAGWNKTYIWAGIISRFMIDLQNITK
ncbi:amylo-alpha-1,6-glucosidase [Melioribacteraceae bacterium 4301-Me]|uniref:amylo-alpha-1,6-glucosidase n=1 Tax=Pyranulibacter aquaticus TaxID=3163344 RepID=UPI003594D5A4